MSRQKQIYNALKKCVCFYIMAAKRPSSPVDAHVKAAKTTSTEDVASSASLEAAAPADCLAILRAAAPEYIRRDCAFAGEIELIANPNSLPGTPQLKTFCQELDRFQTRSGNFSDENPHQVVMLAYHGTKEEAIGPVFDSGHVKHGYREVYGKGAYFSPLIEDVIQYSINASYKFGKPRAEFVHIVVCALILDSDMYVWHAEDSKGKPRPKSYIVNSNVAAQLPLFHLKFPINLKSKQSISHDSVTFRNILDKHIPGAHEHFTGNASTNTKNVGGTKKKRRAHHKTVLYMTLDGKVGEIAL